jgi:hypothetical protein
VADVEALLERHLLQGILEVSWIHPATGEKAGFFVFKDEWRGQ